MIRRKSLLNQDSGKGKLKIWGAAAAATWRWRLAIANFELSFANDLPYGVSCDTFPVKFL